MVKMSNYLKSKIVRGQLLLLVILLISLNSELSAQDFWKQLPLYGGGVSSIAINQDDELFTGSEIAGISNSSDNGNFWQQMNGELDFPDVDVLIVGPNGNIFAEVKSIFTDSDDDTASIYRSNNGGSSWAKVYDCQLNEDITDMVITPDGNIFVAIYNEFYYTSKLIKSADNGATWVDVSIVNFDGKANCLAVNSSGYVYAGGDEGIYRSVDYGENWVNIGVNYYLYNAQAIGISDQGNIFAGLGSGQIYSSTDSGETWNPIYTGSYDTEYKAITINSNGVIFAGINYTYGESDSSYILLSTDNGQNWSLNYSFSKTRINAIDANSAGYIFAGTDFSIYRSTDNGNTWTEIINGLTNFVAQSFATNSIGQTFMGSYGLPISYTSDQGENWTKISSLQNRWVQGLVFNANDHIFAGTEDGLFRSVDNGINWNLILPDTTDIMVIAINSEGHVFVGAYENGVFRSTDNGERWTPINNGLIYKDGIRSFAFDTNGDVYAGSDSGGVFSSTNNGDSWTPLSNGLPDEEILALVFNSQRELFAGTLQGDSSALTGEVYRLTSGSQIWEAVNNGLPGSAITSIVINSPGYIYAGTLGDGVFSSTNNGNSWNAVNSGLTNTNVFPLGIDNDDYIFAGTFNGVFRSLYSTIIKLFVTTDSIDYGSVVIGNYKNDTLTVSNTGTSLLSISQTVISGAQAGDFSIVSGAGSRELAPSASYDIIINFLPQSEGIKSGFFVISSDESSSPDTVSLSGIGVTPILTVSVESINYGSVLVGENKNDTLTISNTGTSSLAISQTEISGPQAGDFSIFSGDGSKELAPSNSYEMILNFSPQVVGNRSAYLIIFSNASSSPDTVFLSGTGVSPVLTISPEFINYGNVVIDENKNDTLTVSSTGTSSLIISQTEISGPQAGDFSIVSGSGSRELVPSASFEITAKFTPQSEGNKSAYLIIYSNAGTSPDTVALNGIGLIASVHAEPEPDPTAGENLTVTVTPSENFVPTYYRLYYRNSGESEWHVIESETSVDSLDLTIPSDSVSYCGVEYYVELEDGQHHVVTYPENNPQSNPARIQVNVEHQKVPLNFSTMTYQMISVPIQLNNADIWIVLGDDYGDYDIKQWRILRWQTYGDSTGYFEYSSIDSVFTPKIDSTFTPGNAFWLITRSGNSFDIENGRSVDSSEPFSYTLQHGWNQVANPFAFPVAVEMISNRDSLESPVYYDGTEYQYEQTILYPWEGYFVFNTSTDPVTISIPPIEASSRGLPKTKNRFETVSEDGYLLQLSGKMPDTKLVDTQNYVGFSHLALDIKDKFDLSEAPPIGDYLQVSIIEGKDRFASNFKSISEQGQQWDLGIGLSEFIKKPIEFALIESGKLPDNFKLFVLDKDYFSSIPIENNKFMLEINKEFPTRKLKLIIGTKEFAQQHNEDIPLQPIEYKLEQNYPNPFNAGTVIQYQLGNRTPVELSIFDILGRKIRVLINEIQTTGFHSIRWDGLNESLSQVASSVYFYRLEAGNFIETKKLLLVR